MGLQNQNREQMTRSIQDQTYDLLIIGGGLTGASLALDATARGMNICLLEMSDFGSGSSLSQSMLISEQGDYDYKTWKQLMLEKETIIENFSALYQPIDSLHVKYRGDLDLKSLGTVKRGLLYLFKRRQIDQSIQILRKKQVLELEREINPENLDGGLLYENALINRSQMTIEILKRADQLGAKMMNYFKVIRFIYDEQNQINGVEAEDQISGEIISIFAHRVINATGNAIGQLIKLASPTSKPIFPTDINRKTQLIVKADDLSIDHLISFHDPECQAFVTVIPDRGRLLVTIIEQKIDSILFAQKLSNRKLNYWLNILAKVLPNQIFTNESILKVNVAYEQKYYPKMNPAETKMTSDSGLISVLGTSWLSSRLYASQIIDLIAKSLKKELGIIYSGSETNLISINKQNQISLGEFRKKFESLSLTNDQIYQVIDHYGDQAGEFLSYYKTSESYSDHYKIDSLLCAELIYQIETGAVYTPLDFFVRRTRINYQHLDMLEQLEGVLNLLSDQLAWTKEERSYFEREIRIWLNENRTINVKMHRTLSQITVHKTPTSK